MDQTRIQEVIQNVLSVFRTANIPPQEALVVMAILIHTIRDTSLLMGLVGEEEMDQTLREIFFPVFGDVFIHNSNN